MTKKTAIMNFIEAQGGKVHRKDLIKFIVELNGRIYDPIRDRGYYSAALCPSTRWRGGYLYSPSKNEPRYLVRSERGVYKVEKFIG